MSTKMSSATQQSTSTTLPQLITQADIQLTLQVKTHPKDLFQILLDQKHQDISSQIETHQQTQRNLQEDIQGCKCTKIDCLKMYCECFSKGRLCNEKCACVHCCNKVQCKLQIYKAKKLANYRHPGTFKGIPAWAPLRRCTCKKSERKKNYCDCYRAGVKCTEQCECIQCQNGKTRQNEQFDPRVEIEVNA